MNVFILKVSSFTIYCINALLFHVSSFTIYYINALVIKASPIYTLKQIPHVSKFVLDFIASAYGKKTKFLPIESIGSPHNSVCI